MKKRLLVIVVLIVAFSLGFAWGINKESNEYIIAIDYKMVKNGNCYIVGTITSRLGKGRVDIYNVSQEQYDDILESFEYKITTKGINQWRYFNKKVVQCEQIKYD